MNPTSGQVRYAKILLCWLLFTAVAVAALNWKQPVKHAVTCMGLGLVLLWVVLCGGLMWRYRVSFAARVTAIHMPWQLRFVLFCTLLAMLEEAITTSITNTAPLYGLKMGQAYITAGSNYVDVIALHGVTLFVSFFVGWAVILTRYRFSPYSVFVLFGLTGTLIESLYGGLPHVLEYAMWTFVYGLMVWLPACTVPQDRPARTPQWYLYPAAVFAPLLFVFLFPLLGLISLFFPHHPKLHFPPISP